MEARNVTVLAVGPDDKEDGAGEAVASVMVALPPGATSFAASLLLGGDSGLVSGGWPVG